VRIAGAEAATEKSAPEEGINVRGLGSEKQHQVSRSSFAIQSIHNRPSQQVDGSPTPAAVRYSSPQGPGAREANAFHHPARSA